MRLVPSRDKKPAIPLQTRIDPFIDSMKRMIDSGVLAHTPASALKSKVIQQVQIHSASIADATGDVSELFLDLCDLLVSGKLSRMPEETFKTYMVVMTYSFTSEKHVINDVQALKKLTGIGDKSALVVALQYLKEERYIESIDEPVAKTRSRDKKVQEEEAEMLHI